MRLDRIRILSDLFSSQRRLGVGEAMVSRSLAEAAAARAIRAHLSTAKHNSIAQGLYWKWGFLRDDYFTSSISIA